MKFQQRSTLKLYNTVTKKLLIYLFIKCTTACASRAHQVKLNKCLSRKIEVLSHKIRSFFIIFEYKKYDDRRQNFLIIKSANKSAKTHLYRQVSVMGKKYIRQNMMLHGLPASSSINC